MRQLPITSDDGRGDHPLTMTLAELYDGLAYLMNEQGMDPTTPVGMYVASGASSIVGLALSRPEAGDDPPLVMLAGEHLPYGVKINSTEHVEARSQPHPHRRYPTRPSLLNFIDPPPEEEPS